MNRALFSTTALFALCAPFSLASAQGIVSAAGGETPGSPDVRTSYFMRGPSQQEQAYVKGLSGALAAPLEATNVVSVRFLDEDPSRTQASTPPAADAYTTGRGLAIDMEGVEVQRLRFRDAAEAQRYALYAAPTDRYPTSVEVRGRQVVLIHGEGLADPERAAQLREAAWDGLPAPDGPPSVAATYLASDQFFIENRTKDPELRRAIERAVEAAEERQKAGVEGFEVDQSGARIRLPNGFRSEIEREGATERVWAAPSEEEAAEIEAQADAFAEGSAAQEGQQKPSAKTAQKGKPSPKKRGQKAKQKRKQAAKQAAKKGEPKRSARKKKGSPKQVTRQGRGERQVAAERERRQLEGNLRGLRQRILESTDAAGPR